MSEYFSKPGLAGIPGNLLEQVRAEKRRREEERAEEVRKRAFSSYEDYLIYSHFGKWQTSRHLKLICKTLESVEAGILDKVILNMPPRHGKSMSVTGSFPSWYLGRHPDKRVIEVSYGISLARKFGGDNKKKIEEFGRDLFGVELSKSLRSRNAWDLTTGGGMISVGISGGITGQGADLLIVDDPVKNRRDAESATIRDFIWDEWQSSMLTRLHAGGSIIVIMTRWLSLIHI